jgi:hypothetical protein
MLSSFAFGCIEILFWYLPLLVILWADCQEELFSTISHIPNRGNYHTIKLKNEIREKQCLAHLYEYFETNYK